MLSQLGYKTINIDGGYKTYALTKSINGDKGEGEQQKKSDMASHYAKKFEDLYEVFNKRVGGGAGRK